MNTGTGAGGANAAAPLDAQRPWLRSYPAGVPAEIDAGAYPSLIALLGESPAALPTGCRHLPGAAHELCSAGSALPAPGAWLRAQGLSRGDRVAVMMPNLLQYMVAIAGILRAGMVVVNVNPLYTARELEHQLKDSGAKAIIVLENFATHAGRSHR